MHALLVHHYIKGAFYPRGGSSEIAFHTIPVIQRAGGAVLTRASVQSVLLDSAGKACGESPALSFLGWSRRDQGLQGSAEGRRCSRTDFLTGVKGWNLPQSRAQGKAISLEGQRTWKDTGLLGFQGTVLNYLFNR